MNDWSETTGGNELRGKVMMRMNWMHHFLVNWIEMFSLEVQTQREQRSDGEKMFLHYGRLIQTWIFISRLGRFPVTGDSFVRVTEFSWMSVRFLEMCWLENIPGYFQSNQSTVNCGLWVYFTVKLHELVKTVEAQTNFDQQVLF